MRGKKDHVMKMWSVGLILVLCVVLASLWCHSKSDAIRDDRDDSVRRKGKCGGASPTAPTIRGLRLSNQGTDVLRLSKIGLYLRLADATGNRIDWLEENRASVQFYTNGLVASKGDAIDVSSPTPDSYATVSREHYVAMPPETSLVIDLNADVPFAAVRVGAVESPTTPKPWRLLVETSAQYTSIADATFTAGFVRGPTTAPTSHISASGIYEYATTPTGFSTVARGTAAPLIVRYIRIAEVNTSVNGVSIWCGKLGLYTSKTDADADTGTSTANKFYAGRAAATSSQVGFYNTAGGYSPAVSEFFGTASGFYGSTTWAYDMPSYWQINRFQDITSSTPTNNWGQSRIVWFDLGAANAADETSGLFLRFGIMGRGNARSTDVRIRLQVSADSMNWYERLLTWTQSGTTYDAKTSAAFYQNAGGHTQMTPASFTLTNRTTGTPRDLSVDANRTGVTRGNRRWDAISISSHDFSNDYTQSEQWWYMFNGVRGSGGATNFNDRPNETNTIGYQLKVGGGLVYSHNVYSLNCTSLYLVTSWENSAYTHLWVVSASNDQVNWTEMATGRFSDRSENNPAKFVTWNASSSDGGIAYQGRAGGSANQFYKLSWTNTQYYVYWRLGIKTAGTPMSGAYCNCGVIYELEWG